MDPRMQQQNIWCRSHNCKNNLTFATSFTIKSYLWTAFYLKYCIFLYMFGVLYLFRDITEGHYKAGNRHWSIYQESQQDITGKSVNSYHFVIYLMLSAPKVSFNVKSSSAQLVNLNEKATWSFLMLGSQIYEMEPNFGFKWTWPWK